MDFCGAEESREREFLVKKREISLRLRSNKHVQDLPPLSILIRKRLFFSTTNFAQKNKKKAKKEMVDV